MKTINTNELNAMLGLPRHAESIKINNVIMHCENGDVLYSYGTLVACKIGNNLYLSEYHDYSATTNKHVKLFTNLSAQERRNALKNETATLINL